MGIATKLKYMTIQNNITFTITITILGSLIGWEVIKFVFPEIQRLLNERKKAKESFYAILEPILKSADELFGKLDSLAKEDFATFINPDNSNSINPEHNKKYVLYLFAQFWGCLEMLRIENQYIKISKLKRGKQLLRFIDTFESRKYRILDRSFQRIIGEAVIAEERQRFRLMTLKNFLLEIEVPASNLGKWIMGLNDVLDSVNNKEKRQVILIYGIIVAALIDNFDPKYKTVRRRALYINKLSVDSKRRIKTHLLSYHLNFLKNKSKFYEK